MSGVRDAALARGGKVTLKELNADPKAKCDEGRHFCKEVKDQRPNPSLGEKHEIPSEHTRYSSRSTEHRDRRAWVHGHLSQGRRQAAHQIECSEADMPEQILEIIPEDEQEKHVTEDM